MNDLWMIGAGPMARDYAKVLQGQGRTCVVIGRGEESARAFAQHTGIEAHPGGLASALGRSSAPREAIVTVGVEQLAPAAEALIGAGTRRILLEKPGGLHLGELQSLGAKARATGAEVWIAYNRRFYASVRKAREWIEADGGVVSCFFEFSELSHRIAPLQKAAGVKEHWVLGNSSHVIDLAFWLCGRPSQWSVWQDGSLPWHPAAARFAGSGITERGSLFSYLAEWEGPGRWGLELNTRERRLFLRPMEQLQQMQVGTVQIEPVELEDALDQQYKPGLYAQVEAFLTGHGRENLCSLEDQVTAVADYTRMAGYEA
jgi:predicted dehydrogenase